MAILEEGGRATACILSEASGKRSRENIVVAEESGVVAPNTVLVSGEGGYAPAAAAAGANTTLSIALYAADATDQDVRIAALVRDAEVNVHTLIFADAVTPEVRTGLIAKLATQGIIAR